MEEPKARIAPGPGLLITATDGVKIIRQGFIPLAGIKMTSLQAQVEVNLALALLLEAKKAEPTTEKES